MGIAVKPAHHQVFDVRPAELTGRKTKVVHHQQIR